MDRSIDRSIDRSTAGEPLLRIYLLGSFRMAGTSGELIAPSARKAQSLLALLGLEEGAPVQRPRIVQLLWPLQSAAQGLHNLRQTLLLLQRQFRQLLPTHPVLEVTHSHVRLCTPQPLWIDVVEFLALRRACLSHAHRHIEACADCRQRMERMIALYEGDLLAQWSPDAPETIAWHEGWKDMLHNSLLQTLQHLLTVYERQGEWHQAEVLARKWITLAPLHEAAHRKVLQLLAQEGRRAAAIRHYEQLETLLREQVGTEPEPETAALFDRIWKGTSPPAAIQPWEPRPLLVSDLRAQRPPCLLTPLLGRHEALEQLRPLFFQPDIRRVVITGPPGIGTSHLAWEAIQRWGWSFPAGVHAANFEHLGLSDVRESQKMLARDLRQALDRLRHSSGHELKRADALILIDQADVLLESPQALRQLDELSRAGLVLLTCHQRPTLPVDATVVLQGLSLPRAGSEEALLASDAVALLMDRARRAIGQTHFSAAWLRVAAELCCLVHGHPWWIELAAHQLMHHTLEEVLVLLRRTPWALYLNLVDIQERHQHPVLLLQAHLSRMTLDAQAMLLELAQHPQAETECLALISARPEEFRQQLMQFYWLERAPAGGQHIPPAVLETLRWMGQHTPSSGVQPASPSLVTHS